MGAVEWLARMQKASRSHNYVGTFVVSAASGALSSARIWHVCQGDLQMERVEALSGPQRSIYRRNDEVLTLSPQTQTARREQRENLELFPSLVGSPDSDVDTHYGARTLGADRVAGFEADVIDLTPNDGLRYGYRIWSERETGLALKLQTLDSAGRPLEQSAFSELQLDAPVDADALARAMTAPPGYKIEQSHAEHTTAEAEGWMLREPVPGFKPTRCYRRPMHHGNDRERTLQCSFSDGLASVSLFVEPFESERQAQVGSQALGATHMLTRRMVDRNAREWWLTAVGEVPLKTLDLFARSLDRR